MPHPHFVFKELDEVSAVFSSCRRYRYRLEREMVGLFTAGGTVNFVMLNPSTADEIVNDPTITRLEERVARWGYERLLVTNLFAWRAADPSELSRVVDPVGPANDMAIVRAARQAQLVICAWGNHGVLRGRGYQVDKLLRHAEIPLHCLRLTKANQPEHPLYIGYDIAPLAWHGVIAQRSGK